MGLISNRGTDPDTRQQARKNSVNQPEGVGQIHGPLLGGMGDSRKSLCSGGAEWECTANSSHRLSATPYIKREHLDRWARLVEAWDRDHENETEDQSNSDGETGTDRSK